MSERETENTIWNRNKRIHTTLVCSTHIKQKERAEEEEEGEEALYYDVRLISVDDYHAIWTTQATPIMLCQRRRQLTSSVVAVCWFHLNRTVHLYTKERKETFLPISRHDTSGQRKEPTNMKKSMYQITDNHDNTKSLEKCQKSPLVMAKWLIFFDGCALCIKKKDKNKKGVPYICNVSVVKCVHSYFSSSSPASLFLFYFMAVVDTHYSAQPPSRQQQIDVSLYLSLSLSLSLKKR